VKIWVEGARPRTLPASVTPVLVGTAAADRFVAWRFAAALVVAVAIQVGVNYANDYFDGRRGVDTAARIGPRRLTASGAATHAQMKVAIVSSFAVAGAAGIALAAATSWWVLAVGAAAFLAALAYSGGPKPYAALGLGELSVFVFFGLVATVGSTYVHDERITGVAVASAIPVGLLATAILVANNIRDIATDRESGKMTLAVRLGRSRTRLLYQALIVFAFAADIAVAGVSGSPAPLLAMIAASLAVQPSMLIATAEDGPTLVRALAGTARLELVFGSLLAIGLALR
jgi:1,4-dihydroxy-2-naphthoate octaprenyltransferase